MDVNALNGDALTEVDRRPASEAAARATVSAATDSGRADPQSLTGSRKRHGPHPSATRRLHIDTAAANKPELFSCFDTPAAPGAVHSTSFRRSASPVSLRRDGRLDAAHAHLCRRSNSTIHNKIRSCQVRAFRRSARPKMSKSTSVGEGSRIAGECSKHYIVDQVMISGHPAKRNSRPDDLCEYDVMPAEINRNVNFCLRRSRSSTNLTTPDSFATDSFDFSPMMLNKRRPLSPHFHGDSSGQKEFADDDKRSKFSYDRFKNTNPNISLALSETIPVLQDDIKVLKEESSTLTQLLDALTEMLYVMKNAWTIAVIGRKLAYSLGDTLREEGGLEALLDRFVDNRTDPRVRLLAAAIISQSMVVTNRDFVARHRLQDVVRVVAEVKMDRRMSPAATEILQCLFKHSHDTCTAVIRLGGLDTLLYLCRTFDTTILRHCSMALANLTIFGNRDCQQEMIRRKAPEWLFPLAFSTDDGVRYYAYIAIAALGANKDLEPAVVRSGTLDLVGPFLRSHDPIEFGKCAPEHIHGQSKEWLVKLMPLLFSRREEAVSLAAFHFAMEATIRRETNYLQVGTFRSSSSSF